ncbi:MAG: hypothetical protein HQ485_01090 [Acidobacteria bacterium]|jgi:hypothetical protein|nr:hypothetical protein [Acidobacteriota bacterium]
MKRCAVSGWWVAVLLSAQAASAQTLQSPGRPSHPITVHGAISVLADTFPAQNRTREIRTRVRLEVTAEPRTWMRLRVEGVAEGLVANRGWASGLASAANIRLREAWTELHSEHVDVRVGFGRLVWGRLDEVMPSDVINPIDTASFFLEGRSAARLPVAFIRTRVFLPADTRLELVAALPGHRSRFDLLDEASSPFNLLNDAIWPAGVAVRGGVSREEPPVAWASLQGGARVSTTVRLVDMSVSAWRGVEGFGLVSFETQFEPGPVPAVVGELVERYPRFTMVATDAEMVVGPWAIRSEIAGFVDKTLSGVRGPVAGKAFDAGLGVDRAVGPFRVFGSTVWHREWAPAESSLTRSYVNVIGSIERRFARERHLVRIFGVANPADASGFVRGVWSWNLRDNVSVDGSGGLFLGSGNDVVSRFAGRDFAFLRVAYLF